MSRSFIPFIDSLGIRSKESPELHPDLAFIMDTIFTIIPFFDPKHEMEMSWKQIVRIQAGNRMDVSLVQVQEVSVITVIYKNPTPVISPVLNLVNQTRLNFYLRYITPLIFLHYQ